MIPYYLIKNRIMVSRAFFMMNFKNPSPLFLYTNVFVVPTTILFFNDKCKKASFRMFNNGVYQIKVMMHTLLLKY